MTTAYSNLDLFSYNNWLDIPLDIREKCLSLLKSIIPEDVILKWNNQLKNGERIGSDDDWFHFGAGMSVRNSLREVLTDDNLPGVIYNGEVCRNWDDYYMGALQNLTEIYSSITIIKEKAMTIKFNAKQTERIKNWLRLYVFPMTRPRNGSTVFEKFGLEIQEPTYEEVMTDVVSYEFIPMEKAKDVVQLVHYGKKFVLDVTEYETW